MPVIAVGMVYYGGTALAAGGLTTMGMLAAGTMVVGGATSLIGTATGDKKLESDGMMVGTIGSLGFGALSATGNLQYASATDGAILNTSKALPGTEGLTNTGSAASASNKALPGTEGLIETANSGSSVSASGTGVNAASSSNSDIAKLFAKTDANMAKIAQQNLIAQTVSGALQGYASYETGKDAKQAADEMRAEQTRLTERDYANRNNLTELTMPTVTGLPNLSTQARKAGLINAAPTTLQTKV